MLAGACRPTPGVVDQHMHGAELLFDFVGDAFPRSHAPARRDANRVDARIVLREQLARFGDVLVAEIADARLSCRASWNTRSDAETDAAGAAGDVGDLALHIGDLRRLRRAHIAAAAARRSGARRIGMAFASRVPAHTSRTGRLPLAAIPPRICRRFSVFSSIDAPP